VNLPENTAMLVRLDNTITVPYVAASNENNGATEVASVK
jgi:hypothetical protein